LTDQEKKEIEGRRELKRQESSWFHREQEGSEMDFEDDNT
jgi:hypothetical protein